MIGPQVHIRCDIGVVVGQSIDSKAVGSLCTNKGDVSTPTRTSPCPSPLFDRLTSSVKR